MFSYEKLHNVWLFSVQLRDTWPSTAEDPRSGSKPGLLLSQGLIMPQGRSSNTGVIVYATRREKNFFFSPQQ